MTEGQRDRGLRVALVVVGAIFIFGVWALMRIWPSGWQWQPGQAE